MLVRTLSLACENRVPSRSRGRHAYTTLHDELCRIVFDEDPYGVGVSAPDDEYSREVSKMIPRLKGFRNRAGFSAAVREMFPTASESFIDRVFQVWTRFLEEIG